MAELSGHNRNHAGSKTEYIYCLAFAEKHKSVYIACNTTAPEYALSKSGWNESLI